MQNYGLSKHLAPHNYLFIASPPPAKPYGASYMKDISVAPITNEQELQHAIEHVTGLQLQINREEERIMAFLRQHPLEDEV